MAFWMSGKLRQGQRLTKREKPQLREVGKASHPRLGEEKPKWDPDGTQMGPGWSQTLSKGHRFPLSGGWNAWEVSLFELHHMFLRGDEQPSERLIRLNLRCSCFHLYASPCPTERMETFVLCKVNQSDSSRSINDQGSHSDKLFAMGQHVLQTGQFSEMCESRCVKHMCHVCLTILLD